MRRLNNATKKISIGIMFLCALTVTPAMAQDDDTPPTYDDTPPEMPINDYLYVLAAAGIFIGYKYYQPRTAKTKL